MSVELKEKLGMKVFAVASIVLLIFMGLSIMLTPNEGAESPYILKLDPFEDRIKYVSTAPPGNVTYEMSLYHETGGGTGTAEIQIGVTNRTYSGGSSLASWDFEFVGAPGGIYYVGPGDNITVILKVTFTGINPGELVKFTIDGVSDQNLTVNDTHLSPLCGLDSAFEYLTVVSSGDYVPYWDPTSACAGDVNLSCLPGAVTAGMANSYNLTIRNLGSQPDNIPIVLWEVWYDENEDGIINGNDTINPYFDMKFYSYSLGGAEYFLNDSILLGPGDNETLKAVLIPDMPDNTPQGQYLIKISVQSQTDPSLYYNGTFKAVNLPLDVTLLNPVNGYSYRPGHIITMAFTESSGSPITSVQYFYDNGSGSTEIEDFDSFTPGIQWKTPLVPMGTYVNVTVYVMDIDCRLGNDTNMIFFCDPCHFEPCELTIIIGSGWNMISISVELDSLGGEYTASTLAAEINGQAGIDVVKYIVKYNASTPDFQEYIVDEGVGTDFPIEVNTGYYVFSTSPFDIEFTIVGDCPDNETVDLIFCWNLIGWASTDIMNVGEYAQFVDDHYGEPVVQAIVKFDKSINPNDYVAWYPGDAIDKFQMIPGESYWIFVTTDLDDMPYP